MLKKIFLVTGGVGSLSLAGAVAQPAANSNDPYVGVLAGARFGDAGFGLPGDTGDVPRSDYASKTAFTGAGMIGFNITTGGLVLGLEGDLMDADNTKAAAGDHTSRRASSPLRPEGNG